MLGSNSSRLLARNYAHRVYARDIRSCNYRESNYIAAREQARDIALLLYFPDVPGINIVVRAVKMIGHLKPTCIPKLTPDVSLIKWKRGELESGRRNRASRFLTRVSSDRTFVNVLERTHTHTRKCT